MIAAQFCEGPGEIVVGDLGPGASVDIGEFARAAPDLVAADAAAAFAMHEDSTGGGVVDVFHIWRFLKGKGTARYSGKETALSSQVRGAAWGGG